MLKEERNVHGEKKGNGETVMGRLCLVALLVAASLSLGGCGQSANDTGNIDKDKQKDKTAQRGSMDINVVSTIEDVKDATVYVEARGGAFDEGRGFGDISFGSGSGFIIDSSGLAVTNNHVVAGSGYLQVYVGDEEEPVDAQILGSSECSDLTLLQLDGGGYPYLEWREDSIESGLIVRAAGFPADDMDPTEEGKPDYTLTDGTVNSTEASGETVSSSVSSVLEHSAEIRPGSSGGPLVDEEGKVVGINYASRTDDDGNSIPPFLAVSRDEAQDIIANLRGGDFDSIGISSQAISLPDVEISGLAVGAVSTGTPADEVGLEPASYDEETGELLAYDLITQLEGTRLAESETMEGATMEEYCNILRQRDENDPISIEVYRLDFVSEDLNVLEGTLNREDGDLEIIY